MKVICLLLLFTITSQSLAPKTVQAAIALEAAKIVQGLGDMANVIGGIHLSGFGQDALSGIRDTANWASAMSQANPIPHPAEVVQHLMQTNSARAENILAQLISSGHDTSAGAQESIQAVLERHRRAFYIENFGYQDVPFFPVVTSESALTSMIQEFVPAWRNAQWFMDVAQEQALAGYRFCFESQGFRPSVPSSPYILGFFAGLPIVEMNQMRMGEGIVGASQRRDSLRGVATQKSVTIRGIVYDLQGTSVLGNGDRLSGVWVYWTRNGGAIRSILTQWRVNMPAYSWNVELHGLFLQRDGSNYHLTALVVYDRRVLTGGNWIYYEMRDFFVLENVGNINIIGGDYVITPPQERPAIPPAVALAPTNALGNVSGVIAGVGAIAGAGYPARENDDVIVTLPVIYPGAFPNIAEADFPAFAEALRAFLTVHDLVMDGARAKEMQDIYDLPRIDTDITVGNPPVVVPDVDVGGIIGLLQGIISAVTSLPASIATSIRNLIFDDTPVGYIPYELEFGDFDFRINLMDYFPFSLPRDLYDIIAITLGVQPAEMAGATTQERALIAHWHEHGEISPLGYDMISPLFIPSPRLPRIEIDIPLPDLSGSNTIAHTWVFDMAEFPTFVNIINWGVFLTFLVGLLSITQKLITW